MAHREYLAKINEKWTWVDEIEYHQPTEQVVKQAITEARPWKSRGMAVHRNQVDQFNREIRQAGLTGAHYAPDGCLVTTSRGQRRAEMKRRGMIDRDAGYGDAG